MNFTFSFEQGNPDKRFGSSETKLLYTLHWIILDAASECEDADSEHIALRERGHSAPHMHSLSTVQLFVYLFAPLIHLMKVKIVFRFESCLLTPEFKGYGIRSSSVWKHNSVTLITFNVSFV